MKNEVSIKISNSVEDTLQIARELSGSLEPSAIVLLSGDLGAGKTVFAKGFAEGMGITDEVTSPTFTIMNCYENIMFHFDLYRLNSYEEFLATGAEEFLYGNGISLVEWPERVGFSSFPEDSLLVKIKKIDEVKRKITICYNKG